MTNQALKKHWQENLRGLDVQGDSKIFDGEVPLGSILLGRTKLIPSDTKGLYVVIIDGKFGVIVRCYREFSNTQALICLGAIAEIL